MIQIDKQLINELFDKAEVSERKRINYDLRTSVEDGSQRMLNAMLPGTKVPIHRHPMSSENVLCLCGKLVEVCYEEDNITSDFLKNIDVQGVPSRMSLKEVARYVLDPSIGNWGCVIPVGKWHTVEVLEPAVIYETKDGKYGEDGTESWN